MNNFTTYIVDDEAKSGMLLKSLIEELDVKLDIKKVLTSPKKALDLIIDESPDLLFLDIDMPQMSGFDMLRNIPYLDFEIIFVTGHNEYALEAFQFSASGYVLKPIIIEDLKQSIDKAINRIESKFSLAHNKILLSNLSETLQSNRKLGVPSIHGIDFLKLDNIVACEGQNKYTNVIVESGKNILSSYNIGEFSKILNKSGFFQAHRSYLINLSKIKQYQKDGTIILENDMPVPLARRRKDEFLELIQKM